MVFLSVMCPWIIFWDKFVTIAFSAEFISEKFGSNLDETHNGKLSQNQNNILEPYDNPFWGSSLPGLRTQDPPLGHRHDEWKFSGAHVCKVNLKHLLQPLRSHILNFGNL